MHETLQKDRLITKYKFLEYDGKKLTHIHWEAVSDYASRPRIDEELVCVFWNVLADEGIVSLDWDGAYGLFNDAMMFCGPRSGNSGAPLFFTDVKNAREYKMAFFLKYGKNTAITEMHIVG